MKETKQGKTANKLKQSYKFSISLVLLMFLTAIYVRFIKFYGCMKPARGTCAV